MRLALTRHPDTPCRSVTSLEAEIERTWTHGFRLVYTLRGEIAALHLPARAEPKFTDGLWRATCFEAFLRAPGSTPYCEINLSPSTEYAVYEFAGYREAMQPAHCAPPEITTAMSASALELGATFSTQRMLKLNAGGPLQLGLSAVIEQADGAKSYWALAHPPGKPDFHHADSFAYELAP